MMDESDDLYSEGVRNLFDTSFADFEDLEASTSQADTDEQWMTTGCGCAGKCVSKFSKDEILDSRLSCKEMKYYCDQHVNHHHQFILGILNSSVRTSSPTQQKQHASKTRTRAFTVYQFRGIPVCQRFFMFVMDVGERELKNLKNRLITQGVSEVMHQNVGKAELNRSLSMDVRKRVVTFIQTFSRQHGLTLPGRVPSFRKFKDLILLPSTKTKLYVFIKYKEVCIQIGEEPIGQSTWYKIWDTFCSHIVVQRPRTDLCVQCQNSIVSLGRLQGMTEEKKREKIESSLTHLTFVEQERKHYYDLIQQFREAIPMHLALTSSKQLSCSFNGFLHYSFDYAQQIFLPHNSQQVGPIYFLAGYKVALFGVSIEPIKKFILYIIPESCAVNKGPNSVISFLDHAIENFGIGETHAVFHADNCVGQNKNNYVMQYLMYQVKRGKFETATISFLPVGHTKFEVDAQFGVFKTKFNRAIASCLRDLAKIATQARSTIAVIIGSEQGDVYVKQFKWTELFSSQRLKPIRGIRSIQHFSMSNANPGIVRCKTSMDSEETSHYFDVS